MSLYLCTHFFHALSAIFIKKSKCDALIDREMNVCGQEGIVEADSSYLVDVDVDQAWFDLLRTRTVSLSERSSFEEQLDEARRHEARRHEAYVALQQNNKTVYVERMIETLLASVPERLTYKGNYKIEHGTQETLKDLALYSRSETGGVTESCEVLQDCIDTTISKANALVGERDLGSFNGDIVLSTHKMSANSFGRKRKLLWTPTENSVMEDERNQSYVRECLEQRLRVNMLKLAYGDDDVSYCVIPCVMDRNHYTMNNNITTNTINDNSSKNKIVVLNVGLTTALSSDPNQQVEALPSTTKKRKTHDEVLQERLKRIRLTDHVAVDGENNDEVYQLVYVKVDDPTEDTLKYCMVCMKEKAYSLFYIEKTHTETNICCTCLRKERRLRSSQFIVIQ